MNIITKDKSGDPRSTLMGRLRFNTDYLYEENRRATINGLLNRASCILR